MNQKKNFKHKDLRESINLIPMINLIFLLLIFFFNWCNSKKIQLMSTFQNHFMEKN